MPAAAAEHMHSGQETRPLHHRRLGQLATSSSLLRWTTMKSSCVCAIAECCHLTLLETLFLFSNTVVVLESVVFKNLHVCTWYLAVDHSRMLLPQSIQLQPHVSQCCRAASEKREQRICSLRA
eukprot:CAMPEP_0173064544 /NCGR_PEP_ID=MMETSP1102-20130122/5063_1 /TAXON_ID=49646 /ORGANISM="Geminigera sp., Strain Caron Lab Isolate" /LENGTH=122 /DNA_ID=CAMNT_0013931599 /DNA_START=52 /DNA_END=420 /DNA_ORIENTATION=+